MISLADHYGINPWIYASLIDGPIAPDATRITSNEIESYIADMGEITDIDGNAKSDALTDGLLLIRYLFGIRGDSLIEGTVANDCSRCTVSEIEAYIQGLMP